MKQVNVDVSSIETVNNSIPHADLSARYSLINTRSLISIAEAKGFKVASVRYPKGKRGATAQHVVRLDLPGYESETVGEYRPQIVLKNSHDGTSRLCIMGGIFRLICENGLVAGKSFLDIRMRHVGLKQDSIEEQLHVAAEQVTQLVPLVKRFQAVTLTEKQALEFAVKALGFRAQASSLSPLETEYLMAGNTGTVLKTRRNEDRGLGLWEVLNRIQENTTRASGLIYKGDDNDFHRLHGVHAIGANLKLNQQLWDTASEYLNAA